MPEPGAAEDSSAEIEQLRRELAEAKDRALRNQAEVENVRRRLLRDLDDERRYASMPLLRDLLPVIDNVDRAIAASEGAGESPKLIEGVKMIAVQLRQVLAQHRCTEIEALHKPFDPHLHQAISQQPSAEFPPETVILVAVPGYVLHDRVVRPAQVIVSRAVS